MNALLQPAAPLKTAAAPAASPLLRIWPAPPRPRARVVCLSWCGGTASGWRPIAERMAQSVTVNAVQLPGREERFREPAWVRMEMVVHQITEALLPLRDLPLVLLGHSMGSLVAHEVALSLRARGRQPHGLVLSGHAPPHMLRPPAAPWHRSSQAELAAHVQRLGGTPAELLADPAVLQYLLRPLRADFEVLETYQPRRLPPLDCPVLVCAGYEDELASPTAMRAWEGYGTGPFQLRAFDGGHFYLQSQPDAFVQAVLDWLPERRDAPARPSFDTPIP